MRNTEALGCTNARPDCHGEQTSLCRESCPERTNPCPTTPQRDVDAQPVTPFHFSELARNDRCHRLSSVSRELKGSA